MKPLVRQVYTNASMVAMLPAGVWAVVSYGSHSLTHILGLFPYYYLLVCQLLMVSRYVLVALLVQLASRLPRFDKVAAIIAFVAVGVMVDTWVTIDFARDIARPPDGWAMITPLVALPFGLCLMGLAAILTGLISGLVRLPPPKKPAHPAKR